MYHIQTSQQEPRTSTNEHRSLHYAVFSPSYGHKHIQVSGDLPIRRHKAKHGHILHNFKHELDYRDKRLYKSLQISPHKICFPCFYGIHKKFTHLPPLRPIVSQSVSPLSSTAKFIDHVLQPITASYPD